MSDIKPQKLTLAELVQSAKTNRAEAFGNVNDKRGLAITRAVLSELREQIAATEEGVINIAGFGKFTVKPKTVLKDGQELIQRRIVFRANAKKTP